MDLVEGISNEVLLAFIVTILLIVIAVFYTFFSEGTSVHLRPINNVDGSITNQNIDRPTNNENVDGSQSRDSNAGSRSETNASDSSTATTVREETSNLPYGRDLEDVMEQTPQSEETRGDKIRRRQVNGPDSRQDQSTDGQDETMVVKVKHNENIQTFNVSKNITVIELKRLAFNNELNAGRRVRFVYAGQLLRNDNDPLTRYGVLPNTVVHCVITDPPEQIPPTPNEPHEEDLDLSRFLIPLLTVSLIMAWYGLISYKHIFTGSSIAILMFLTSLYVILVYVTTIQ
ncbi:transmembrane and ubiquitin-like domain-containing 1 [Paramuricea clavata]|uniref:Transmembrane and ubiquitin-like domain-containing 1 n=1 Tax=Paramuricea clavata TaxID=317549 RepID=A0A7D9I0A1_PARCT|nr:transmembrane and ubiquitin-like domain-containing 1 [Paramuricea clavata]